MNINIPVTNTRDMFIRYLQFLNPVLGLRENTEIPVLACYLTFHYKYKDYKIENLNSLLFSDDTSKMIQKSLSVSEKSFNKSRKRLEEKQLIINNEINSKLTQYPKDGKFKINISFIEDNVK